MSSGPLKTVYIAPPRLYSAHTTVSQSFGPNISTLNVDAARLSPNGDYFAVGYQDGTLKVHNLCRFLNIRRPDYVILTSELCILDIHNEHC
jgi:hypothetical protein